ncbi:MAG: ribosomal protein S18-alanine N-acetyltransferase [Oscillospiraceae bacterium]|nr:ribosomal protein S18-alanine N-acetyltransferase [Oscillospiraceae bacterium]
MTITIMTALHVSQVAELEKLCFSDPWSEKSVASELENKLAYWLVAVEDDRVAGYVGSQTVCGETDMMNIAVHPDFRRRGIAESLVNALVEDLQKQESHSLTLEVRASNEAAQKLYEKLGFMQVGLRKNYYRNPKEDAYILRKEWEI